MKSFLLATLCLAAFAEANPTLPASASSGVYVQYLGRGRIQCRQNCRQAQNPLNDCNIVDCPPAVRNGCNIPDCSLPGNINRLHPHPDPNFFFQCQRTNDYGGFQAVVRPCACETVFSATVDERRCVHQWEWLPDCSSHPSRWQDINMSRAQCRNDCEECGDGPVGNPPGGNPPPPPTPPANPPPTPPANPPPGPDNCPCICICIWFPCQPCARNCPCNNNNNNNNNNRIQDIQRLPQPSPPQQWRPEQRDPWSQPQLPQQPQLPSWQPELNNPWNPQDAPHGDQWNHDQRRGQRFSVDEPVELQKNEKVEEQDVEKQTEN